MSRDFKISVALVLSAAVSLIVAAKNLETRPVPSAHKMLDSLVRSDSEFLSIGEDGKVTFVEFFDFECGSCRAAQMATEALRKTYAGRVTFVARNFPLHHNSEAAARAAAAAGAQGRFVEMYNTLFETQPQWAGRSESQEQLFFGFAEALELDMAKFKSTYNDPANIERIRRDKTDGVSLGVTAAPTLFLNGKKVETVSYGELIALTDAALAA